VPDIDFFLAHGTLNKICRTKRIPGPCGYTNNRTANVKSKSLIKKLWTDSGLIYLLRKRGGSDALTATLTIFVESNYTLQMEGDVAIIMSVMRQIAQTEGLMQL
jgi:hypothetical protein